MPGNVRKGRLCRTLYADLRFTVLRGRVGRHPAAKEVHRGILCRRSRASNGLGSLQPVLLPLAPVFGRLTRMLEEEAGEIGRICKAKSIADLPDVCEREDEFTLGL